MALEKRSTQEAKDETQAGKFISLISNQLGQKVKDYLRQIISYEYPEFEWAKDNFKLNESYRELVEEILAALE